MRQDFMKMERYGITGLEVLYDTRSCSIQVIGRMEKTLLSVEPEQRDWSNQI